jgi:hypothetical protein
VLLTMQDPRVVLFIVTQITEAPHSVSTLLPLHVYVQVILFPTPMDSVPHVRLDTIQPPIVRRV